MTSQLDLGIFAADDLGAPPEPQPDPGLASTPPAADTPRQARTIPVDPFCLPAMQYQAGYEMYRDGQRTLIRRPGESRWGATVRIGPTSHRFVGAGEDPAVLWVLAWKASVPAAA
jgi:hypothetical protein